MVCVLFLQFISYFSYAQKSPPGTWESIAVVENTTKNIIGNITGNITEDTIEAPSEELANQELSDERNTTLELEKAEVSGQSSQVIDSALSSWVEVQSSWNLSSDLSSMQEESSLQEWIYRIFEDVMQKKQNSPESEDISVPVSGGEDLEILGNPTQEKSSWEEALQEITDMPDLYITEVYFDGSDERMEITNESAENFSWDVSIVWAKATEIFLTNINIPSGESMLFWDNLSMVISQEKVLKNDLGLSIYDTRAIDISLIWSWTVLDTFQVDEASVDQANNTQTSFQRFSDTHEIFMTSWAYRSNVETGYIANPWMIFTSTDIGNDEWNTGETGDEPGTGDETSAELLLPKLLISEAYPYDKPYLEITNLSDTDSFSGEVVFSGSTNFAQNISLSPRESFILYTDPSIFEDIQQFSWIQTSFDFITTTWVQLDLIFSWVMIDTFIVHADRVQKLSGDKTSFEKIGTGETSWAYLTTYIWLNLDRVHNTKSPYLGNPWKLFTSAENTKNVTKPISISDSWESIGLQPPINCNNFRNTKQLKISEIFPWNQTYHPFIEIENPWDITASYDYLLLSWTALSWNIYYPTEELKINKSILLTDTEDWYNEWLDALANPDFILQNSWRITVYGVNYDSDTFELLEQEVLDVLYYSGFIANKSLYYDAHDIQCGRIFDEALNFSPTFDDKLLQYFSVQSDPVVKTVYVGGWWWGCSYDRQINFDPAPEQETDPVAIKTIKYHSPDLQQIILKSTSSEDVNLRNYRIQTLNPLKYYPLPSRTFFAEQDKIMTGNFYLPRQDSCVNLLHDDVVVDRYCYARLSTLKLSDLTDTDREKQNTPADKEAVQDTEDPEKILSWNVIPDLRITQIDYDPKGTDTDNEKIYFAQNISEIFGSIDSEILEKFSLDIYKNNELYKTRKFSPRMITSIQYHYLQGDFQLPNTNPSQRDIVVNLLYQWKVVARAKYNPYQDKNTFNPWEYTITSVIDWDTFRIKYKGKTQSVRLLGIDTPESSIVRYGKAECYGKEAKKYLKTLINKKTVKLVPDSVAPSRDKFGRRLAYVYLDDMLVNQYMLTKWYAREYTYNGQYYDNQSTFKNLAQQAQSQNLGMWSDQCKQQKDKLKNGKEKTSEELEKLEGWEGQEEWKQELFSIETLSENYDIKIQHINYDPEGRDYDNETITLLLATSKELKITDKFRLVINGHRKKLPETMLLPWEQNTLKGNFQFPNSKATCVDLSYDEYVFDTYCYNPDQDKKQKLLTGIDATIENYSGVQQLLSWNNVADTASNDELSVVLKEKLQITILALLPNPKWKDTDREQIQLAISGDVSLLNTVYLQQNAWKIKTIPDLKQKEGEQTIVWTLGLKNTASCINIYHKFAGQDTPLLMDRFCYIGGKDGQRYSKNSQTLATISAQTLEILTHAKLKRLDTQTCMLYEDETIRCIRTPKVKYKITKPEVLQQTEEELKLYKNFTYAIKDYLQDQWYPLYQSNFSSYFSTLYEIQNNPERHRYTKFDKHPIKRSDFQNIYKQKQKYPLDTYLKKYIYSYIPQWMMKKYDELFALYIEGLEDKI